MDLTASFLRAAGAKVDELDGVDLLQHVESGSNDFSRTLFWRARRGERTWKAVRDGDLKYVYVKRTADSPTEEWLFDLATDPYEKTNLKEKRTEDFGKLKAKLVAWEAKMR